MRIHAVQTGGLAFAAILLLTRPIWDGDIHETIEMIGFGLVLACVAGRTWSILYVGSKKNRELVTSGPYSMTRSPLYFFSTIGAVGIGLIHGSVTVAFALGLLVYMILILMAGKEAKHLRKLFGSVYDAYALRTPAFWPNLSRYREPSEVVFSPVALRRTFLDGLFFLAAFPLIEAIEHLQAEGFLPILMRLY
jgi:protein-S-isoprenylcysteine O-methyltransferase Ste14